MATASLTHTYIAGTLAKASEVNQNFSDILGFLNVQVIHRDASIAFTAIPSGPASDPTTSNQYTRKAYVDKLGVQTHHRLTSNGAAVAPGGVHDLSNTPALEVGRYYMLHVHSRFQVSSSGDYNIQLRRAGAVVAEMQTSYDLIAGAHDMIDGFYVFLESAGGNPQFNLQTSPGSSGSVTLLASAANPRTMSLIDLGP